MESRTYDAPLAQVPATGVRLSWLAAPLAAIVYPLPLAAFHAAVVAIDGGGGPLAWVAAAGALLLAFAVPAIGLLVAARLSAIERPSSAELVARRVALVAVAAPPLYNAPSVPLFVLGRPALNAWLWTAFWGALIALIVRAARASSVAAPPSEASGGRGMAHGVVAALVLAAFLLPHLGNLLAGLVGPGAHRTIMNVLRHVYRARLGEPAILAGMLFLALSGGRLAWALSAKRADGFRVVQLASGVYLLFFLFSHVDAVLVLARQYLRIDSDWDFATAAPAGLIRDASSIRLVPYYAWAVFFALAHSFAGARVVLLGHGARKSLADGVATWGTALSAATALAIILGMCGLRIHLA